MLNENLEGESRLPCVLPSATATAKYLFGKCTSRVCKESWNSCNSEREDEHDCIEYSAGRAELADP